MPKLWKLSHLLAIILHLTIASLSSKIFWATTVSSLWKWKIIPMDPTPRILEVEHFTAWDQLALLFPYRGRSRDCLTSHSAGVPKFRTRKVQRRMSCFACLIYLQKSWFSLRSRNCKSVSFFEKHRWLEKFVAACTLPLLSLLTLLFSQICPRRRFCLSILRPFYGRLRHLVRLVAKRKGQKLANFWPQRYVFHIHTLKRA